MKLLVVGTFLMIASLFAWGNEIDLLKEDLKKAYPQVKDEDLKAADKFETNKEKTVLIYYVNDEIYFAHKKTGDKRWVFSEVIEKDPVSLIEFKAGNKFSIYINEGGTSHSETVSTWKLEGDTFKVIGQDSKAYSGWNHGAVISSVNYLTGKMNASSSSAKQKKRSGTCKFHSRELREQKLSDINMGGAKEPDCKFAKMPDK